MDWQKYFDKSILDRGYAYYNNNEIICVLKNKNQVTAKVSGSETYEVNIDLDDLSSMRCSCPYSKGGNKCKHLAAVLFAIDDHKYEEMQVKEERKEDEYDIERMVNECDELFLRYFLSEIIKDNKNIKTINL